VPPLCRARHLPQSVAACLCRAARRIFSRMGTKSRETIYGGSIRAAAERATEGRKQADRLAVEAWNKRMLGFQGPAQPSPTLRRCDQRRVRLVRSKFFGCNTHQTIALDIVRRPTRRSMNSNATCGARTALRSGAIRTSEAIWSRCASPKSRRVIRPRHVAHFRTDNADIQIWRTLHH
jgi:hypothetical protein